MNQESENKELLAIEEMTVKELRAEIYSQNKKIDALKSCVKNTISSLIGQGILNKGEEVDCQNIVDFIEGPPSDIHRASKYSNITNNYFIVIGSHNYQAGGDINLSSSNE